MQHKNSDQIMVVLLNDLVQQSIPRIAAIRQKLQHGGVLTGSEIDFFQSMLQRLSH